MPNYLVCLHTCEECICDTTMTILWPRKHANIQRHAVNPKEHLLSTASCPANRYLSKNVLKDTWDSRAVWHPTQQEYNDNVTTQLHGSGHLIDSVTKVYFRGLKVLYVTDPVQAKLNKVCANMDHSFVKTLISYHDFGGCYYMFMVL